MGKVRLVEVLECDVGGVVYDIHWWGKSCLRLGMKYCMVNLVAITRAIRARFGGNALEQEHIAITCSNDRTGASLHWRIGLARLQPWRSRPQAQSRAPSSRLGTVNLAETRILPCGEIG